MEKPTNSEIIPDELMSDTPEEDHELGGSGASQSVTARSYECTFCKRGFSNAQALGGHMNIHRKDKAKLIKQPFFSIHQTKQQKQQQFEVNKASDHGNMASSTRWPNRFLNKEGSTDHDDHQDYKDQKAAVLDDHQVHGESGNDLSSPAAGRSSSESEILDLELRLGPQPPQDSSSSANMATRKFF